MRSRATRETEEERGRAHERVNVVYFFRPNDKRRRLLCPLHCFVLHLSAVQYTRSFVLRSISHDAHVYCNWLSLRSECMVPGRVHVL